MVESSSLLALHNALAISKIMRHEFPNDWYASLSTYSLDWI